MLTKRVLRFAQDDMPRLFASAYPFALHGG